VELLHTQCFSGLICFSSLTFEVGSKLRLIESDAFEDCECLKSISLPVALSEVDGSSFHGSWLETVSVDAANPHYFANVNFLSASKGMLLVRHFGFAENVIVPPEISTMT
jgi:hypothetical protein